MSTRARFWLLCACTFFHFLSMGIFLSGLPLFVSNELGGSKAAVGFAVGCFSLTAVLCRPFVGRRIDRLGRAWFLRGAPLLIALTSVGLLAADALGGIIALRLLQGVAGAAFYTGAATMATDLAPDGRRAEYISRFSLFLYGGFAAGPALGEFLVETRSFASAWLGAALSATVALVVAFAVPESRVDDEEGSEPRPSRRRWVHPAAIGPGMVLLTIAVGYTAITSFMPLYSRSIGMGSSGGLYTTFALSILVVRLVSGRLADRLGRVAVALPGCLSGAAGMMLLAVSDRPAAAFVGVALFGAGHALIFPALMAHTVDQVPDRERGEALGSFTACFDVGASTGGYLVGYVADQAGYSAAWATPGVICLVGAVVLLVVVRPSEKRHRAHADELVDPEPAGT